VTLATGQTLIADIVLSAIGLQPNISLAKAADIQTSRGIITNTYLKPIKQISMLWVTVQK
jgi:rubredoxin-NAD+ reductase